MAKIVAPETQRVILLVLEAMMLLLFPEVPMNSDIFNHQVIRLSQPATNKVFELIQRKILNEDAWGSHMNVSDDSVQWHFEDGSIVEIEVRRSPFDDDKAVAVVVMEWIDEPCFDNFYTIISRDRFELGDGSQF